MAVDVLADRFVLERQVGAGAMGSVYKAWDKLAGNHVAVKLLHAESTRHAERFEREAVLLAEVSHPAIVKYVAHGRKPTGEPYLVMEWLEGHTLEERLEAQGLTALESTTLGIRVLEGCAAAHRAGIVHRDIKPANLFLVDGKVEKVKIADFGIARRLSDPQRLTHPGIVVGTPLYMSPEQARGDAFTDQHTDVFSIGCVLFECLTGDAPFVGINVMAILAKIILESPAPIRSLCPGVPQPLEALVEKMLAKNQSARPPADELSRDLLAIYHQFSVPGFFTGSIAPRRESLPSTRAVGTRGEQRVMCVVLVGRQGSSSTTVAELVTPLDNSTLDGPAAAGIDLTELGQALSPHGGKLSPLLDGSMIVTVSGSLAPTEQAVQAARCALALRDLLPSNPVALCTGRAVLGGQVPIGAVIDQGVRLLISSAAGSIRLDEASAGLLDGRFEVGGSQECPELRGEQLHEASPRTLLGKVTSCVGRERDLDMLEGAFDDCTEEPGARAVLVTGPAGGGKSRLRHELLRRLRAQAKPFELLSGRADSLHAGSPFALLAPALRRLAGVDNSDSLESKREKVRLRVARHVARERVSRVAEFLGELMGVPFPDGSSAVLAAARQEPRVMADQIMASWLDFLEAECAAGPVLVVLEDLHWGDLPSVQLLDAALRTLDNRPLMVLGLARPELDEHFPALFRQRDVIALRLGRLPRKACERLVEEALGDRLIAEKRAWLIERSDGNAFYLEELIRAMASGAPDAELPDTVLGMVQARLDRLGDEGKRVLRAASVFGETFRGEGARALLGGERCLIPIDEWLTTLVEQELIFSHTSTNQTEYAFRNALLRDAAYAMLTEEDRVLGHRLAALWLEDSGELSALVLAEHFERGKEPTRAAGFYRAAAEKALEANDLSLVISCADRGVSCGAGGDVLGDLAWLKAEAHQWRGEFAQAELSTRDALRWLVKGSAPWYRAAGTLVMASCRRGSSAAAESVSEEMLALAENMALDPPRSIPMALAAADVMLIGRLTLAEKMIERIKREPASSSNDRSTGYVHAAEAYGAVVKSADASSCLKHARAALESFQRAGDLRSASWQLVNEGFALLELGLYASAETSLRDAATLADRIGVAPIAASARQNLGTALLYQGALDKAEIALAAATDSFRTQGDLRQEGACRMYTARLLVQAGHLRRAENEAKKAVELLMLFPGQQVTALATLAHVLLAQGGIPAAIAAGQAAMDLLQTTGAIDEGESFVRLVQVRVLDRAGEYDKSREALAEAERRVFERARKISDETLRKSFLENVADNRELLKLAAEGRAGSRQASSG